MSTWAVVALALVVVAVLKPVWDRYRHQKLIEARRRYADIGARCATDAGFVMDDYSDGLWGDNPAYNFKHRLLPDLTLTIQNSRWAISEALAELIKLPEPKFQERRGTQLSISDFRNIADEYRSVVEWRRRTVGWGCGADLRQQRAKNHA